MSTTTVRPIDRVLDKVGYTGPRDGHKFKCHCPSHQDRKESLSITEGNGGTVLIHCHAGCDTKKIVAELGLTFADLRADKRQKPERPKGRIAATYNYVDEQGNLLFQTVRLEPKQFKQRQRGADGQWVWSLNGARRVLYELPRLLAAEATQWVFIVEGEKDCNALIAHKLVATSNPMGAGKWQATYNQWLIGKRVCILPDNDERGRNHAHTVAQQLVPIAAQVRVVDLPGLSPKGDVSDWLASGGTAQQLLALVDSSPDYAGSATTSNNVISDNGILDKLLIEHPTHDHGNAQVVDALYPGKFLYCPELGWLQSTGSYWEDDGAEFAVHRAITEMFIARRKAAVELEREDVVKGTTPNEAHKNAVKGMYRDIVAVTLGEFDNDPNVLNCSNGVIDLCTGELVAHGPSNRFTYCVQTPYSENSDQRPWLSFLNDTVGDYSEIAEWLQMAFGYTITGLTREECLFYIHGPTRSGKGTFANAGLTLLGSPLARGVDFNTFTQARDGNSQNFDLAPLRAARFISASESGRYSSLNEAVVKNITGNDPITAAFKYHDPFTYTPQFKIWMMSNHPVKGDVEDDAFWGRLRVVTFPNSHLDDEDKGLKWRMSSPAVLPGILAWAVEGARRWYAALPRGLQTPFAVSAATKAHRDELDHVQLWLNECAKPEPTSVVTVPNLYASYKAWCEENGQMPKQATSFGRAMVAKGFTPAKKKIGDTVQRAYKGLILRPTLGNE